MAYLVYCIMKAPVVSSGPMTGVTGKGVSFVTAHGLGAAVSELASVENAPLVSELLVYGRVVEDLYRMQAVVPMRYGCFLEGLSAIRGILEERKRQYDALLKELEGRVEMGIRILIPERVVKPPQDAQPADVGRYLALRKAHYRMRDESSRHHQALLDGYVQTFSGLHDKQRTEMTARNGSVVLSLYFLIPKIQVDRFRETFQRVVEHEGSKILLSGPWPPYNFTVPDLPPSVGVGSGCEQ
jgi:hypothetical protein